MNKFKLAFSNGLLFAHLTGAIVGILIYLVIFLAIMYINNGQIFTTTKLVSFNNPSCSIKLIEPQYAVFEKYGLNISFIEECESIK